MKTREQKEQIIADLIEKLKKVKSLILTDFSGLKTKDLLDLKNRLSKKGIDYNVVKNTLFLLALKKEGIEIPRELLDRPLALAFSYEDEIEPVRILYNFTKENENLEILGGIQNKEYVEVEQIKTLAMLPTREELYGRLVYSFYSPKLRLLNLLTQNPRKLIYLLKHITVS